MLRPALRFFAIVLGVYLALTAAWPALKRPYAAFYRGLCGTVFYSLGQRAAVTFRPLDQDALGIMDTEMVLQSRRPPGAWGTKPTSARYDGFVPSILAMGLAVATPVPWRRRLLGAVASLAAIHVFVILRRGVSIVHTMSQGDAIAVFDPPPAIKFAMTFLTDNVFGSIVACSYVLPVFVWLLVMVRRHDWERLHKKLGRVESTD